MPTVSVIIPVYKVERYLARPTRILRYCWSMMEAPTAARRCAMHGQKRTPASGSYTAKTAAFPLRATPESRRQAAHF